jgi:hypothetical protein
LDIPELFYDCRWTDDRDHYKTFIFQYEAEMASYKEGGKYWFRLPGYGELGEEIICFVNIMYKCVSVIHDLLLGEFEVNISK